MNIKYGKKCPCCGTQYTELSKCEKQVYPLMLQGLRAGQIADIVHKSPKTVTTYMYRIREKMELIEYNSAGDPHPMRGVLSVLLMRKHCKLLLARWSRGVNRDRLLERGATGRAWIEGYEMAMHHILNPSVDHIHAVEEVEE